MALHKSSAPLSCFKEGFLEKKGGGTSTTGRRNWKKRWFVLTDKNLIYFTVSGEKKGELAFNTFTCVDNPSTATKVKNNKDHKHPFCFSLTSDAAAKKKGSRVLLMEASSRDVKEEWVRYLILITSIYHLRKDSENLQPKQKTISEIASKILSESASFLIYGDRFIRDTSSVKFQEIWLLWSPNILNFLECLLILAEKFDDRNVHVTYDYYLVLAKLISSTESVWNELSEGYLGETKSKVTSALENLGKTVSEVGIMCRPSTPLAVKNRTKSRQDSHKRQKQRHNRRKDTITNPSREPSKIDVPKRKETLPNNHHRQERASTVVSYSEEIDPISEKMIEALHGIDNILKKKSTV